MTLQRLSLSLITIVCFSCGTGDGTVIKNKSSDTTITVADINDVQTVLPQAGNVSLIENNCMPCHSLRYVEMQPEFTYAGWEKIVDKMIHVYGAPIRDTTTRRDIINYLYAIKGR